MNKIKISLAVAISISLSPYAQNVGFGVSSPSNKLEIIGAVTPGSSAVILGTNTGTTGSAIIGFSNAGNTFGVKGSSNNGFGVQGYTNNNIAISGLTLSGTALSASSFSGYAVQVSGNLKFSGGNTNPSVGAVLTSDAVGEATWKKSNIAFLGAGTTVPFFTEGVFKKVEFINESYDLQNDYSIYNGGVTSASSVFTAPVAGVYHFSSNLVFSRATGGNYYFRHAQIKLVKNGATIASYIGHPYDNKFTGSYVYLQINGDFHLDATDKVWIEAAQYNDSNTAEGLATAENTARFSGHLVVAD